MATMTDNHRYLIQFMLKNGVTTVDNAQEYCKFVSKGEIEDINMLERLVAEINGTISKQSFKLKFFICEVTNQKVLVWLNTKNDDISKLQIKFSPVELEYFHAILQELIHNEEHRLTTIVCINITSTLTSHLTRENGQKLLNIFLKNGYFVVKGAYIYLGPRLILEFTIYLKTHCPESVCTLCSELVFCGNICHSCRQTAHSHCLTKYLEMESKCPSCQATLERIMEVDEVDDSRTTQNCREDVNEEVPMQKQKRRQPVPTRNITSDDSSSEEDPNEPGPSTRGPSTRRRRR